jgi:hypothetical protein
MHDDPRIIPIRPYDPGTSKDRSDTAFIARSQNQDESFENHVTKIMGDPHGLVCAQCGSNSFGIVVDTDPRSEGTMVIKCRGAKRGGGACRAYVPAFQIMSAQMTDQIAKRTGISVPYSPPGIVRPGQGRVDDDDA